MVESRSTNTEKPNPGDVSDTHQIGQAAKIRDKVPNKVLSKKLHFIAHSADKNPHKHGPNEFANNTGKASPKAQKVIDKAKELMQKTSKAKPQKQADDTDYAEIIRNFI